MLLLVVKDLLLLEVVIWLIDCYELLLVLIIECDDKWLLRDDFDEYDCFLWWLKSIYSI